MRFRTPRLCTSSTPPRPEEARRGESGCSAHHAFSGTARRASAYTGEVLAECPYLERVDILAVLEFATESVERELPIASA